MPRPPDFDGFEDIRFITNYFLMGCGVPRYLVVDFSKEPLWDVALLICTFDVSDIAQEVLQPGGARNRRSGRHGRKSGRITASLDPNEFVGAKIRAKINPLDVLQHSPLRRIFPLLNAYEGVAFTAAVADGITDVGFETLWGILNVLPGACREFARFTRHYDSGDPYQLVGGVGPPVEAINLPQIDFVNKFATTERAATCFEGNWNLAFEAALYSLPTNPTGAYITLAIHNLATGEIVQTGDVTLGPGDTTHLTIGHEAKSGEFLEWGVGDRNGFFAVIASSALGYVQAPIFQ